MSTPHKQNTVFPITADHLVFCGNNVGLDGDVHIQTQEHTSKIHLDNHTVFEKEINVKDKINDNDGDNIFQLSTNDTKIEHNKLTKFNQNIDFNDKEVSNLAGFDGKFTSSQIVSSNRAGQAPPNNTLDKEIDDMLISIGNLNSRTSNLVGSKIIRSNGAGTIATAGFDTDKIVRNDLATQQEIAGDVNLASGKRIKYNGVAVEISSADKLNKDFTNIGSNILPEANTDSSIARVLALNNGLDLKADKTGVVFTGDVSLNTGAITASKPLEVNDQKKIVTSTNLLMTQAERDKVANVPSNTNNSLSTKADLSGSTFTGDIKLNNLTASKVLVLDDQKDITTSNDLLMTSSEQTKLSNVPTNTNNSLSTKADLSGSTFTGDVRLSNLTASKVLVLDGQKDITTSDDLLMTSAEQTKLSNVPANTNNSLSTKANLSGATFTGDIRLNNLTASKVLVLDGQKDITTSDDTLLTSAQSNAISTNTSNITTITNNYIKKDGTVDFTGNILVPTLEVGTTGYTITKDGNNDLIFNVPSGEIYKLKINNATIATIDSGGIDLASGKTYAIDGSDLSSTDNSKMPLAGGTFSGQVSFDNSLGLNGFAKIVNNNLSAGFITNVDVPNLSSKTFTTSTLSGTTTLSSLTASKFVKTNSNKQLESSDISSSDLTDNSNIPKLNTTNTFSQEQTFNNGIRLGDNKEIRFGTNNIPVIAEFNESIIIATGDNAERIEFKTFQGGSSHTHSSFVLRDQYAEIDDNYNLRLNNIATGKFLKTDSNKDIEGVDIADSDIPNTIARTTAPTFTGTTTIPILRISDKIEFEGSGYVAFNQGTEANGGNMIYDIPAGDGSLLFAFRIGGANHALIYADGIKAGPNKNFIDSQGGFYPQASELVKNNADNQTIACNNFTFTAGTNGDCIINIKADTDNSNEFDNPKIVFHQDGGGFQGNIGMKQTSIDNRMYIEPTDNASTELSCGGNSYTRLYINHGNSVKIEIQPDKIFLKDDVEIDGDLVISGLTASQFVKTDGNKKLVSSALSQSDLPSKSWTSIATATTISFRAVVSGFAPNITITPQVQAKSSGFSSGMAEFSKFDDRVYMRGCITKTTNAQTSGFAHFEEIMSINNTSHYPIKSVRIPVGASKDGDDTVNDANSHCLLFVIGNDHPTASERGKIRVLLDDSIDPYVEIDITCSWWIS